MPQPLKVDRVFEQIIGWIRRLLWYRQGEVKVKPYDRVRSRMSPYGVLYWVERKSDRAIRTFVFVPSSKNQKGDIPDDLDVHIYLDHLFPISGQRWVKETNDRGFRMTHCFTVLLASRRVDPQSGAYSLLPLFSQKYCVQRGESPHSHAIQMCDRLAVRLLHRHLITIYWEADIKEIGLLVLGSSWAVNMPAQSAPPIKKDTISGVILDDETGKRRSFKSDPKQHLKDWRDTNNGS